MKVALVHDWLVTFGGAERVLRELLVLFPKATLFTICDFLPKKDRQFLENTSVETSFVQHLPFAKRKYRSYLPLMPYAIEQFNLEGYDLVISSHHAVAKGVITGPDQLHVCLCHSPMRYAWDMQHQYLRQSGLDRGLRGFLARRGLHRLRDWDVRSSYGVDRYIAISEFIARRIHKVYRRDSRVIYSPVDVDSCRFSQEKEDFYLTASRFVPYKRMDLIVEAFSHMPNRRLIVVGDGPEYKKIRKRAGKNVELLGYQSNERLKELMSRARGFLFAAKEDFGIVPIEALASGTPVIAFGEGGALETISQETGLFFYKQDTKEIQKAVMAFESRDFSAHACRAQANKFSAERWRSEIRECLDEWIAQWIEERKVGSAGSNLRSLGPTKSV